MERPFGKLAPGMEEVGTAFKNMWKELDENSEKFGCTFALPSFQSTRHRSTIFYPENTNAKRSGLAMACCANVAYESYAAQGQSSCPVC